MDLRTVLQPAIRLAEEGFPVAPVTSFFWQRTARGILARALNGQELTIAGQGPAAGQIFRNPGLARTLRSGRFTASVDQAFGEVIHLCATSRGGSGTWLTPEMIAAYCRLHELGVAHSVESWVGGRLAGGIYGISLGRIFFGESMVSVVPDGSKAALAALASLALAAGIELIDCQVANPHLLRLGATLMPRREFLGRIARGVREPPLQRLRAAAAGPIPLRP